MLARYLLVGCGGFLGSMARFWLSGFLQDRVPGTFPLGTLAVNAAGCLLIGAVSALADRGAFLSAETRAFVMVGILGGFTTFSAFGNETINLMRDRDWALAGVNVLGNVALALGAVWVGRALVQTIWR